MVVVKFVYNGEIGDGTVKQMRRWSSSGNWFEVIRDISEGDFFKSK